MLLTVALVLGCAMSLTFLLIYGLTRPWWRSWEGRALIASSTGWALVTGGFLIDTHVLNVGEQVWVFVAYVAAVAAALKLWILVQASRDS